jgi:pyruvate dehydrogenase E2 component (dihydrolipoyllysine-residue acetyltransferase)
MPFTLTMPKLSPTMEEGTIVKWHKKVGDFVESGDLLLEIATDKATVEHNALDEGWVRKILVQEGGEAAINQPIAILTADKEESIEGFQPIIEAPIQAEPKEAEAVAMAVPETVKVQKEGKKGGGALFAQPEFVPEPPLESSSFEYPTDRMEKRLLASPLAKKLAKEKGVDLSSIKGSGPNQRIMSRDLEKGQPSGLVNFSHREAPSIPSGSFEEIPLSPMRKTIGKRLQESKSFIPHFYISQVVDAQPLVKVREELKNHEMKISVNDFIVRACALALRQHPQLNRGFNSVNQTIVQFKCIDIAIAVVLEEGLMTPIVRYADYKNLGEISVEIRSLAKRAKEGKLDPTEYKGGSFTISNLGMFGITDFQAILNPPQAAILAVSGIQNVPVVNHGAVIPGKTLNLTLSVDHRVVDGVAAALFLQTLKKLLENPSILLIG